MKKTKFTETQIIKIHRDADYKDSAITKTRQVHVWVPA